MTTTMADDQSTSSMAKGLAILLGPVLVDRLVDSQVNPDDLIRWMNQEHENVDEKHLNDFVTNESFVGPMDFRVDLRNPKDPSAPTSTALMEFGGLRWRVTRVKLPMTEIEKAIKKIISTERRAGGGRLAQK